ncbi:MAG TPA: hypothetical protein VF792_00650 [Ktedonobacterales bacterium]
MPSRRDARETWDDQVGDAADAADYGDYDQYGEYGSDEGYADDERGLILQTEQSLVGVSSTVTQHGAPLLSYTRTMNRFYTNRRQRLSLGRHVCEVCGERIRFWAWETPNGNRTHDGCYERLAWTWTNLYAQQQALANRGQLE